MRLHYERVALFVLFVLTDSSILFENSSSCFITYVACVSRSIRFKKRSFTSEPVKTNARLSANRCVEKPEKNEGSINECAI